MNSVVRSLGGQLLLHEPEQCFLQAYYVLHHALEAPLPPQFRLPVGTLLASPPGPVSLLTVNCILPWSCFSGDVLDSTCRQKTAQSSCQERPIPKDNVRYTYRSVAMLLLIIEYLAPYVFRNGTNNGMTDDGSAIGRSGMSMSEETVTQSSVLECCGHLLLVSRYTLVPMILLGMRLRSSECQDTKSEIQPSGIHQPTKSVVVGGQSVVSGTSSGVCARLFHLDLIPSGSHTETRSIQSDILQSMACVLSLPLKLTLPQASLKFCSSHIVCDPHHRNNAAEESYKFKSIYFSGTVRALLESLCFSFSGLHIQQSKVIYPHDSTDTHMYNNSATSSLYLTDTTAQRRQNLYGNLIGAMHVKRQTLPVTAATESIHAASSDTSCLYNQGMEQFIAQKADLGGIMSYVWLVYTSCIPGVSPRSKSSCLLVADAAVNFQLPFTQTCQLLACALREMHLVDCTRLSTRLQHSLAGVEYSNECSESTMHVHTGDLRTSHVCGVGTASAGGPHSVDCYRQAAADCFRVCRELLVHGVAVSGNEPSPVMSRKFASPVADGINETGEHEIMWELSTCDSEKNYRDGLLNFLLPSSVELCCTCKTARTPQCSAQKATAWDQSLQGAACSACSQLRDILLLLSSRTKQLRRVLPHTDSCDRFCSDRDRACSSDMGCCCRSLVVSEVCDCSSCLQGRTLKNDWMERIPKNLSEEATNEAYRLCSQFAANLFNYNFVLELELCGNGSLVHSTSSAVVEDHVDSERGFPVSYARLLFGADRSDDIRWNLLMEGIAGTMTANWQNYNPTTDSVSAVSSTFRRKICIDILRYIHRLISSVVSLNSQNIADAIYRNVPAASMNQQDQKRPSTSQVSVEHNRGPLDVVVSAAGGVKDITIPVRLPLVLPASHLQCVHGTGSRPSLSSPHTHDVSRAMFVSVSLPVLCSLQLWSESQTGWSHFFCLMDALNEYSVHVLKSNWTFFWKLIDTARRIETYVSSWARKTLCELLKVGRASTSGMSSRSAENEDEGVESLAESSLHLPLFCMQAGWVEAILARSFEHFNLNVGRYVLTQLVNGGDWRLQDSQAVVEKRFALSNNSRAALECLGSDFVLHRLIPLVSCTVLVTDSTSGPKQTIVPGFYNDSDHPKYRPWCQFSVTEVLCMNFLWSFVCTHHRRTALQPARLSACPNKNAISTTTSALDSKPGTQSAVCDYLYSVQTYVTRHRPLLVMLCAINLPYYKNSILYRTTEYSSCNSCEATIGARLEGGIDIGPACLQSIQTVHVENIIHRFMKQQLHSCPIALRSILYTVLLDVVATHAVSFDTDGATDCSRLQGTTRGWSLRSRVMFIGCLPWYLIYGKSPKTIREDVLYRILTARVSRYDWGADRDKYVASEMLKIWKEIIQRHNASDAETSQKNLCFWSTSATFRTTVKGILRSLYLTHCVSDENIFQSHYLPLLRVSCSYTAQQLSSGQEDPPSNCIYGISAVLGILPLFAGPNTLRHLSVLSPDADVWVCAETILDYIIRCLKDGMINAESGGDWKGMLSNMWLHTWAVHSLLLHTVPTRRKSDIVQTCLRFIRENGSGARLPLGMCVALVFCAKLLCVALTTQVSTNEYSHMLPDNILSWEAALSVALLEIRLSATPAEVRCLFEFCGDGVLPGNKDSIKWWDPGDTSTASESRSCRCWQFEGGVRAGNWQDVMDDFFTSKWTLLLNMKGTLRTSLLSDSLRERWSSRVPDYVNTLCVPRDASSGDVQDLGALFSEDEFNLSVWLLDRLDSTQGRPAALLCRAVRHLTLRVFGRGCAVALPGSDGFSTTSYLSLPPSVQQQLLRQMCAALQQLWWSPIDGTTWTEVRQ
eukprot:GHVQ01020476.1.p1 GENE.GHVQ01020476.1~~GHVQ01020476.1.p1  ORF type:complete len:1918 (-),score=196.34 GHVQ01020476.1:2144-7651(-)